jgi:hypothetical protein
MDITFSSHEAPISNPLFFGPLTRLVIRANMMLFVTNNIAYV